MVIFEKSFICQDQNKETFNAERIMLILENITRINTWKQATNNQKYIVASPEFIYAILLLSSFIQQHLI